MGAKNEPSGPWRHRALRSATLCDLDAVKQSPYSRRPAGSADEANAEGRIEADTCLLGGSGTVKIGASVERRDSQLRMIQEKSRLYNVPEPVC